MPIYEYQCDYCGVRHEALQRLADPALTDCPQCKQAGLRRQISAAGFRLKGGGWYETDFKSGQRKNIAEGSAGATTEGGSPAAANGNATPAA